MTLRKSDFTNEAIEIGLWDALLEEAGMNSENADDVEIEILKGKVFNANERG